MAITTLFRQAANAQQTDEIILFLLEFIGSPVVRITNNEENIVSNGETYIGCRFEVGLPDDLDEKLPEISLSIQNVDRELVSQIRGTATRPTINLSIIVASAPNDIVVGPIEMSMHEVEYDVFIISGSLKADDLLHEPCPGHSMTPALFPGLF